MASSGRRKECVETEMSHGCTSIRSLVASQYHKFTNARVAVGTRVPQLGGGLSPVNGIGVAPVTVPMVALSLT